MSIDREYKIRIQTVNEGSGAADAASDLKNVGKSAEDAGEGMNFFETKGREFHRLLFELDKFLPGLGTALRAVFNPATLGVGGLLFVIERVKDGIDAWKKKMDDLAEAGAKADFAESIKAALDVTREAADAADEWQRKMAEIQKGEHGVAVELNNQLQLIAAIQAAREQQAEAEKTLALAKLKEQETLGGLSPSDAIIKRGEIEKKYASDKAAADEANFRSQQQAREAAINEAAEKQAAYEKDVADKQSRLDQANADKAFGKAAKPIDEVRKAQQDAQDARDEFERFYGPGSAPSTAQQRQAAEAPVLEAEKNAELLERQYKAAQRANAVDTTKLEKDLKTAKEAEQKNLDALAKARDEKENAQRNHDAGAGPRGAAEQAGQKTIDTETTTQLVERMRELQRQLAEHGAGSLTRQQDVEMLGLLKSFGQYLEQGKDAVTQAQLRAEMDNLKRLINSKGK